MRPECQTGIRLLALLLLLGTAGCGLQLGYTPDEVTVHRARGLAAAPVAVDSVTVVSWNIAYGKNIEQALRELGQDPRLATADVLLLQEMDPTGSRRIAAELGFHLAHASASVSPRSRRLFGNAVLSRWPILAHEVLVLPHETPLTGHRRLALAADIDLGGSGRLRAVSIHTATMLVDQDARREQARAAADSLAAGAMVVVGGDFNTVSAYEATLLGRDMRRRGLRRVRLPDGPTYRAGFRRMPGETAVLDHVFVRGVEIRSSGVGRETTASDHFPVWTVLGVQKTSEQPPVDPLY